ncbi:MAG: hypothetical protein B7Z80_14960 [Rhodospirillales bacterium 20-64-7]|nr:MAG: hypothetical protein B7Z80_14960 [Rhodospirillales bacterium 20-64-7]HQT77440.1 energy transducer TonB [Rhodopila sp.]
MLAIILSCLFHAGLALVLLMVARHQSAQSKPHDPGTIELVMVQKQGKPQASPTPPSPPSARPTKPAPRATPPTETQAAKDKPAEAKEPQTAEGPPTKDKIPPPQQQDGPEPLPAVTAPAQPAAAKAAPKADPTQPTPAPAQPKPPVQPKAPVFDLAGNNSDYNAIAFGSRIVPAAPDSRYHNNPPRYPAEAAMRGEHGAVMLLIHVSAAGVATGADIMQTSGYASLDSAAIAAVRTWHFHPAMEDGKTVPFDIPFRFVFDFK